MADNENENREEEVNENGGRADAFKPITSNDAGTDHEAVQYFDEDDPNGEYRDAQTDLLEDRNALKKEQDRQFVERGIERTNDPLATSYGALEANRTTNLRDAAKNEVVVGTGMRLADDRSWEERYNAMQARKRAERQDLKNSSMARQELLNTGRYFDDGRGNIKLKQSERKTRERLGRGWHEETTADNGFGNWYVNGGWKQALDAQNAEKASASKKKMSDFISLNRQSLKEIETARKEKDVNSAKAKFALFGGIAAAYDALKNELANTDESSFTPEKAWALGKDAKGNVTTGDMQNTGKYMKRGFVTGKALQSLNQEIKSYGGDYQVVGLMAQQKFNDVKGSAYGKPMIIARIKRFDEATGKPVYSDEIFSLDRAYQMGMDFGKAGDVNDYKNLVWDGIGDIHGEQKRAIEAATAKDRAKLAIEQERQKGLAARNDANIAAKERMNAADNKTRLDIAAIRERTLERKKTSDPKFDEKHYNAFAARLDSLTKDADGNDRDPSTMTDADRKKAEAIQTAMDDMLFGKVNTGGAGDQQGAEAAAGGANAGQGGLTQAEQDEYSRLKELKAKRAAEKQNGAQAQAAQGQQMKAPDRSALPSPTGPRYGGVIKPGDSYTFEPVPGDEDDSIRVVNSDGGVVGVISKKDGRRFVYNKDATSDDDYYSEIPKGTPAPWEKSDAKTDGAQAQAAQGQPQNNGQWGLRNDGKTYKGTGWLGVLKLPNGGVASEYTVGVNIDGQETDIPTLVPTLTPDEVKLMVNDIIPNRKDIPNSIMNKAVAHAKSQLAKGESVFANDGKPPATGNAPQQNVQNVGKQSGAAIVKDVVEKNGGKKQKGKVVNAKKPETKSTQTGNNVTETASSAVRRSDKNYEEAPMMPEERRAKIMKELKDWQWQQKQIGNDVSDEELEELADRRMEDETGVRPIRRSASKK